MGDDTPSAGYNLRIGSDKDNGHSLDLCLNSFLNLVAIGQTRHAKLDTTRFLPGKNTHSNGGYIHFAISQELLDSVISFIKENEKTEGKVYGTRVIHSLTKNELRDEEKGDVDLPSNTSKRNMYDQYFFNRGWAVNSDNKGRCPKVPDYKRRNTDDMFWKDDMEAY
jgi:hypothetical protein